MNQNNGTPPSGSQHKGDTGGKGKEKEQGKAMEQKDTELKYFCLLEKACRNECFDVISKEQKSGLYKYLGAMSSKVGKAPKKMDTDMKQQMSFFV